ncbi:MAG: hypothetical protein ACOCXJ_01535 [Planctomycetota bacterium]
MSDSQFAEDSIEAMLVAIADGVREAQLALSEAPPVDAFGRPLPRYQLPQVDFNIQVQMKSVRSSGGRGIIRFVKPMATDSQALTSTIAGRLSAVPPGEGLPLPRLFASSRKLSARKHQLAFVAVNSAGERLPHQTIELNLNLPASQNLSRSAGIELESAGASRLAEALLETDAEGGASTELTLAGGLPIGAVLVYTAELGNATVNVSIPVEG